MYIYQRAMTSQYLNTNIFKSDFMANANKPKRERERGRNRVSGYRVKWNLGKDYGEHPSPWDP